MSTRGEQFTRIAAVVEAGGNVIPLLRAAAEQGLFASDFSTELSVTEHAVNVKSLQKILDALTGQLGSKEASERKYAADALALAVGEVQAPRFLGCFPTWSPLLLDRLKVENNASVLPALCSALSALLSRFALLLTVPGNPPVLPISSLLSIYL